MNLILRHLSYLLFFLKNIFHKMSGNNDHVFGSFPFLLDDSVFSSGGGGGEKAEDVTMGALGAAGCC